MTFIIKLSSDKPHFEFGYGFDFGYDFGYGFGFGFGQGGDWIGG